MRLTLEAVEPIRSLLKEKPGRTAPRTGAGGLEICCSGRSADEPPAVLWQRPGSFGSGYSVELDGVLNSARSAKNWIANLEKRERERTGIKSLKVGFNKVFGYYLEITKANQSLAPEDYIRKQTLVNAERYITPELKEYEAQVLNADERQLEIESRLIYRDMPAGGGGRAPPC